MSIGWAALHSSLIKSTRSIEAKRQFRVIAEDNQILSSFESPSALIAYLNHSENDRDVKDAIYAALIETVQARNGVSTLSSAIIWLGLWPPLDSIYRGHVRYFVGNTEELVSEIADKFTSLLYKANLSRISRVAFTVVRNTKRNVRKAIRCGWIYGSLREELSVNHAFVDPFTRDFAFLVDSELSPGSSIDEEISAIREWLIPIIGDDADLVIGAVIYQQAYSYLGQEFGLTYEVTRKRYQRAIRRLKKFVKKNDSMCPKTDPKSAFNNWALDRSHGVEKYA